MAIIGLLMFFLMCFAGKAEAIDVRPGDADSASLLGYGWSHAEPRRGDSPSMRWIEKREGELMLPDEGLPATCQLIIEARPICSDSKIQNMGVFVNGQYVDEWVMTTNGLFADYVTEVPKNVFKRSGNTLILRAGYIYSPENESRDLSIAVRSIQLLPKRCPFSE